MYTASANWPGAGVAVHVIAVELDLVIPAGDDGEPLGVSANPESIGLGHCPDLLNGALRLRELSSACSRDRPVATHVRAALGEERANSVWPTFAAAQALKQSGQLSEIRPPRECLSGGSKRCETRRRCCILRGERLLEIGRRPGAILPRGMQSERSRGRVVAAALSLKGSQAEFSPPFLASGCTSISPRARPADCTGPSPEPQFAGRGWWFA